MMTKGACRVLNRIYDPKSRSFYWQETLLEGVFWQGNMGIGLKKAGIHKENDTRIFVPFSVKSERSYAQPEEFEKAPEAHFTFRPEDKIVRGEGSPLTIKEAAVMDYGSRDMRHIEIKAV